MSNTNRLQFSVTLLLAVVAVIFLVFRSTGRPGESVLSSSTLAYPVDAPRLSNIYDSQELGIAFSVPSRYEVGKTIFPQGGFPPHIQVRGIDWYEPRVLIPYPLESDPGYRENAKELQDFATDYVGATGEMVKLHSSEESSVGEHRILRQRYSTGSINSKGSFEPSEPFGASNELRYVVSDGSGKFLLLRGWLGTHEQQDQLLRKIIQSLVIK